MAGRKIGSRTFAENFAGWLIDEAPVFELLPVPGFAPVSNGQPIEGVTDELVDALSGALEAVRNALRFRGDDAQALVEEFLIHLLRPAPLLMAIADADRFDPQAYFDDRVRGEENGFLASLVPESDDVTQGVRIARLLADRKGELDDALTRLEQAAAELSNEAVRSWVAEIDRAASARVEPFRRIVEEIAAAADAQLEALLRSLNDDLLAVLFDDRVARLIELSSQLADLYVRVTKEDATVADILDAVRDLVVSQTGIDAFDTKAACETLDRPIAAIRPLVAALDAEAFALANPTIGGGLCILSGPEISEQDQPNPPEDASQPKPGSFVYDANKELAGLRRDLDVAAIQSAIDEFTAEGDQVPQELTAQAGRIRAQLSGTLNTLEPSLEELMSGTAGLYCALVNDGAAARSVKGRLDRLADTSLCDQIVGNDGASGLAQLYADAQEHLPADLTRLVEARKNIFAQLAALFRHDAGANPLTPHRPADRRGRWCCDCGGNR
jgi:hypothetical protein